VIIFLSFRLKFARAFDCHRNSIFNSYSFYALLYVSFAILPPMCPLSLASALYSIVIFAAHKKGGEERESERSERAREARGEKRVKAAAAYFDSHTRSLLNQLIAVARCNAIAA
jgi:hypothetical protein